MSKPIIDKISRTITIVTAERRKGIYYLVWEVS
jgi:hypothetical protein